MSDYRISKGYFETAQSAGSGVAEEVIRAEGLKRTYRIGALQVHALNGIDVSIPKGLVVAFKGRSGSGKTTLLNILGGLDEPDEGHVYVEGRQLAAMSEQEITRLRRTRIGFVFQSFALVPTFSAYENVELPLRIAGASPREREQRASECLDMVGLLRWAEHRPYEMSGGQQQRIAIARALANKPALILADEPTGELDSGSGRRTLGLFKRIADRDAITVVIATHDPIIEEFAAIIYELSDGKIAKVSRL
jgi:ABC-type lipoprotein export system ATPase subunit